MKKLKQFTYNDYLQYRLLEAIEKNKSKNLLKNNGFYTIEKENKTIMQLNDQSIEYKYEVNNPHDKIFRLGLDNEEEVAKFLNEKLDIEYELKRRKLRKI